MSNEAQQKLFEYLVQEFNITALQTQMFDIEYIINEDSPSLVDLEADRFEWSSQTFPEATALSSLCKLESEVLEIKYDVENGIRRPVEYADAMMCLLDSASRQGITVKEIINAFATKTQINKTRTWVKNPDNSYSHVK